MIFETEFSTFLHSNVNGVTENILERPFLYQIQIVDE